MSPGHIEEQAEQADETTLQLSADFVHDGFLLKEVPHRNLPDRLKREFVQQGLSVEEVLDITVVSVTPKKRTKDTFKTPQEIIEEQLRETEYLAGGLKHYQR